MKRILKFSITIVTALLLAGCSVTFANQPNINPLFRRIHLVQQNSNTLFSRTVRQTLTNKGFVLVNNTKLPTVVISDVAINSSTASIYQDGTAAQNNVIYTVRMEIKLANNAVYVYTIKTHSVVLQNPNNILANNTEANYLNRAMDQKLANDVYHQLIIFVNTYHNQ